MKSRKGYKQTEVGVIPEDWDVIPLKNEISALSAGVSVNSVDKNTTIWGYSESVLKTSCVSNGYFNAKECKKILPKDICRAKLNPKKDSIIFSRMNTPVLVGECGYINADYPNLFLPDRLWQTSFKQGVDLNIRWLAYVLSFGQFSKAIKETATGTSSSMKNIAKDALLNVQIPLPPTKAEQTAIANALSDADAWIQSLTRLITKKCQIKQGAMQTLLNPYEHGRLKTGWVEKTLGDIVDKFIGGGTPRRSIKQFWGNDIPWVTVKDFATFNSYTAQESITFEGLKNSASHLIPSGTIITATRMALGKAVVYDVDVCINQDMKAIFPTKEIVMQYMLYWFEKNEGTIADMGSGSTVMGLSLDELKKIDFPKPPVIEQTRIATILSDMDSDITALKTKLTKARQIKQGMMQNLLTGRIRLI